MNDWQSMELHELSAYSVRHCSASATKHLCLTLISSLTVRLKSALDIYCLISTFHFNYLLPKQAKRKKRM